VVRTAVDPLLWLVGLIAPCALIAAVFIDDRPARLVLISLVVGLVIATFIVYITWMFRDPDRLQSEEYRIKQSALKMLYKKGHSSEIVDVANQPSRIEVLEPRSGDGEKE
jgi:hypothetical protein